jgi:beta-phosphoglucomutase
MKNRLALIFDMDGVIVDSTAVHTEAWRQYLQLHGIEINDIQGRMLGRHNDDIVRDFFAGTELTGDLVLQHGYEKEKVYRGIIAPHVERHLIRGARDFVRRHAHLPLGLASNAEPANVDLILDRTGLRNCFPAIVNGHEVARPKPSPDIYLRAAELLNTAPADCIVFEDSETGVRAAKAAGMRVAGVATTVSALPGVDLLIADFDDEELEPWLREASVPA